jgi:Protein of unknown function (DUF2442)
MSEIIKVVSARAVSDIALHLLFSNGTEGVRDFSDVLAEGGPMVEPLKEPAFFRRVFVSYGVPSWPNGFDVDAIALHDEMRDQGLLRQAEVLLNPS